MPDIVDDAAKSIEAAEAEALRKITNRSPETNDSGFCLLCDEKISEFRLTHLPGANHCIECQSGLEYKLRQAKRF